MSLTGTTGSYFEIMNLEGYIPYSTMTRISDGVLDITQFYVSSVSEESMDKAEMTLEQILLERFGQDEEAFTIVSQSVVMEAMEEVTGTLTLMLGGIAGISLLVGGIGIMNIMLVSVTERTREIGIRKAIGAGRGSILFQFLSEAVMVSLMGCGIGIVLAVVVALMIGMNYMRMTERADSMLHMLASHDGKFLERMGERDLPERLAEPGEEAEEPEEPQPEFLSPETPYETRYFSVNLNDEGAYTAADTRNIASVDDEAAIAYAEQVWESGNSTGFVDRYRYLKTEEEGGWLLIFLDCRREYAVVLSFVRNSLVASAVGLLAVFSLVLFFSRMVFRPVAESYEKQEQFITDASHELKTPLTIIDANTEVLEMENGASPWLDSIRKQTGRLASLTEQMVMLSRLDEGKRTEQMTDFSLSDSVQEAAEPFRILEKTGEKKFQLDLEPGITCHGEEAAIRSACLSVFIAGTRRETPGPAGRVSGFLL